MQIIKSIIRLGLTYFLYSLITPLSVQAQAQLEMSFTQLGTDSAGDTIPVFSSQAYTAYLISKGWSTEEASRIANWKKADIELSLLQQADSSGLQSLQIPITQIIQSIPTVCGQTGEWPGELGECFCPETGSAPMCPDGNIGFESGDFSDWIGRIGIFERQSLLGVCPNPVLNFDPTPQFYTGQQSGQTPPARHLMIHKVNQGKDRYGSFGRVDVREDNNYSVRLGNDNRGAEAEQLIYYIRANAANKYLQYRYAVVLEDPGNHLACMMPSFSVELIRLQDCSTSTRKTCASKRFTIQPSGNPNQPNPVPPNFYAFDKNGIKGVYRPWTSNIIDLSQYFEGAEEVTFILKFTTTDCAYGGHFGYGYIDGVCTTNALAMEGDNCAEAPVTFYAPAGNYEQESFSWKIDGQTQSGQTGSSFTHTFNTPNSSPGYNVQCDIIQSPGCTLQLARVLPVELCYAESYSCEDDCIRSFSLEPGKKYILSAWVREKNNTSSPVLSYTNATLHVRFGAACSTACPCNEAGSVSPCRYSFTARGQIIDGWQRIEEVFTAPASATEVYIEMENTSSTNDEVYFDDIRLFPFDGSMKCFVYDPASQKLLAEMDENHYATLYEYNSEGKLVRVKKETERGVKTVKESMTNTSIKP